MRPSSLRRAGLGLAAVLLLGLAAASPASAAGGLTFTVGIPNDCINVNGPATALGSVSLLTSTGSLIQRDEVALDGNGEAVACFNDVLVGGMRLSGTTGGVTHTLVIPKLTIQGNRVTDVLSGTGPTGASVTVYGWHSTTFKHVVAKNWARSVSSTGHWSVDTTSTFNLIGGDQAAVQWSAGADSVTRWYYVPRLDVTIGHPDVYAPLTSGVSGTVVLRSSTGTVRAKTVLAGGIYEFAVSNKLVTGLGLPVAVRIGDRLSAPFQPDMAFKVPSISIAVDPAADVVAGTCPAHRAMLVEVLGPSNTGPSTTATCPASGSYHLDVTASADIKSGDRVIVSVRTTAGDVIRRNRYVP